MFGRDAQAHPGPLTAGEHPGEEARSDLAPQVHLDLLLVLQPNVQLCLYAADGLPARTQAGAPAHAGLVAIGAHQQRSLDVLRSLGTGQTDPEGAFDTLESLEPMARQQLGAAIDGPRRQYLVEPPPVDDEGLGLVRTNIEHPPAWKEQLEACDGVEHRLGGGRQFHHPGVHETGALDRRADRRMLLHYDRVEPRRVSGHGGAGRSAPDDHQLRVHGRWDSSIHI